MVALHSLAALPLALAAASLLTGAGGQSGSCPHGALWIGSSCPRTSLRSLISEVTGCCATNQLCPQDSSEFPGRIEASSGPDSPRTCHCGTVPDPPQPDVCLGIECTDGQQNNGEAGIDCGGSCAAACPCGVAGKPACICDGQAYGNCPWGNTVAHFSCQDGCAPSASSNYTSWCIERRHRREPTDEESVCANYPAAYPAPPPTPGGPAPPDSADECWFSCSKMLYFKVFCGIVVTVALMLCMHRFKLGCFKPKQVAAKDELYEGNPNLTSFPSSG
jgi:hypothetical protein